MNESSGSQETGLPSARTIAEFKTNRYDSASDTVQLPAAQAEAFERLKMYYAEFFGEPSTKHGLRPTAIRDPRQIAQLTAYFCWSAWVASALRPGHQYSYTNN